MYFDVCSDSMTYMYDTSSMVFGRNLVLVEIMEKFVSWKILKVLTAILTPN